MNQKPILFSTPMVQAILEGRKTMTRRIIPEKTLDAYYDYDDWCNSVTPHNIPTSRTYEQEFFMQRCKWGVHDFLWVRETWQHTSFLNINHEDENYGYVYKADSEPWEDYEGWQWKPSIFMPKEAARIWLQIIGIRVERLQDISEADAIAEGVSMTKYLNANARYHFMELWKSINGEQSWSNNPWVWVIEFKKVNKP